MAQITSTTSTDEVQNIYDYYGNDFDKIAAAIQAGDLKFSTDDLITAYVEGTNKLPTFMQDPLLDGPDKHPELWLDTTVQSLKELGDLYQGQDLATQINTFLGSKPDAAKAPDPNKKQTLLDQIQSFLDKTPTVDPTDPTQAKQVFDMFAPGDLKDVMSLFLQMGNIGMVLLLYTAFGANEAKKALQQAALDVLDELNSQKEDLMGQLQDLDPTAEDASYQSQVISQQLQTITTVMNTMMEFIKNAQEMVSKGLEAASTLSEASARTDGTIIHNMA